VSESTCWGHQRSSKTRSITKQRARDADEFWHLQGLASRHAVGKWQAALSRRPGERDVAPRFAVVLRALEPPERSAAARHRSQARSKHEQPSLILLIKVGSKRLLFPGDAQLSLWESFEKRSPGAMTSLSSTMPNVHGSKASKTEVPRGTLTKELERGTHLHRTDKFRRNEQVRTVEYDV
jgi:hypothetical protein